MRFLSTKKTNLTWIGQFLPSILFYLSLIFFLLTSWEFMQLSLWRDEAFSARLVTHSLVEVVKIMADDFAPPGHPILLWLVVQVLGRSEISLRLLSFVFTLFTAIYLRKLLTFKDTVTTQYWRNLASAFFFMSYLTYYYATEARYYAMFTFLTTATFYYTLKIKNQLDQPTKNESLNKIRVLRLSFDQLKWILLNTLLLYTHTISLFVFATNFLILFLVFLTSKKKSLPNIIKTWWFAFVPVLFFIPWLLVMVKQFLSLSSNPFWLTFDPWTSLYDNVVALFFWSAFDGGLRIESLTGWSAVFNGGMVLILLLLTVVGAIRLILGKKYEYVLAGFLPLVLVYLMSFKQALFYIRYICFIFPFLVIFIIYGLQQLPKKISLFLTFLIIIFYGQIFFSYYHGQTKPHHREVSQYIKANFDASWAVVNDTEFSYFSCEYYIGHCYIAKPKKEIANVGIVLIDEAITLPRTELTRFDKFVFISWNSDPDNLLKDMPAFQLVSHQPIADFHIYSFKKK